MAAWYTGYLATRDEGRPSRTRRGIQQVVAAARPVRLLETNIHSVPTKSAADLPPGLCTTDAFEFLLEAITPRAVYVHGAEAREWLNDRYGFTLTEGDEATTDVHGAPLTVITSKHLSRASCDVARAAGSRVQKLCIGEG
jgi:hypothetical protein